MKKHSFYIACIGLTGLLAACTKTWESVPLERYTADYVWDTKDSLGLNARKFLTSTYSILPEGFTRVDGDFLDASTDDAVSSIIGNTSVQLLATGAYTSLSYPNNSWSAMYNGIRRSTVFLNNFDVVPLNIKLSNGTPAKASWKAEARFLRAFFYFELIKRYGGVPVVGDQVREITDNLDFPRASFDSSVNYVVGECDKAIVDLQVDPISDLELGRATKGAAMALKARLLLYAASPLFNGQNIDAQNVYTGYTSYDAERWNRAAVAAKAIMDYGKFSLQPAFKDIFITSKSQELIFQRENGNNNNVESTNGPVGFTNPNLSQGRTSPSQNLVDAFPMKTGIPIGDPGSGYNANTPYVNRDPRFYVTVMYNGFKWLNRPIQTYIGGVDNPTSNITKTQTSYYLRKFMGDFENQPSYASHPSNFIMYRYGEVLLNFAEALNEYAGPTTDVYSAVQAIRQRAGLVPFALTAGLTKDQMRTIIRNERRLELSFEEHRFYDIRRWKLAETVMNQPIQGLAVNQTSAGVITYQRITVLNPKFAARQYLLPIPYDEVAKVRSLVQNPGW